MQLTINHPSGWITASKFKPFLLIGVAGVSSVALYTPLSSQAKELGDKLDSEAIKKISPISKELADGSQKLFEQLASWAKYTANATGNVKDWAKSLENAGVENGAKQIYKTLEEWAKKVYEFLKDLLSEQAWENFKNNMKKLGHFLNLFKNLMKLELGGKASIFSEVLGKGGGEHFDKFMSSFNEIAEQNPDMTDDQVKDLMHAFKEKPKETAEMMENFANKKEEKPKLEELMNSVEPAALVSKIKIALKEAEEFDKVDTLKDKEQKEKATKLYNNLNGLYGQLKEVIKKAEAQREKQQKK